MKLQDILEALGNGAVLHLTLADKPTWKLNNGITEVTISSTTVRGMIKRGKIVGSGDGLFPDYDIPSQTWRATKQVLARGTGGISA